MAAINVNESYVAKIINRKRPAGGEKYQQQRSGNGISIINMSAANINIAGRHSGGVSVAASSVAYMAASAYHGSQRNGGNNNGINSI